MRFTLVGTLAVTTALATGCATVDSDLQYRGSLTNTPTTGLVLFEDGESGHAAMHNTTCVVDPDGGIAEDVDVVEGAEETVVDGSRSGDSSTVLTRTRGELHVVQSSLDINGWANGDAVVSQMQISDVVNARLTTQGMTVATTCGISWLDNDGLELDRVMYTDMGCTGMDPAFDVDRLTGNAYVNIDDSIYAVTPDGITAFAQGDLLAYSPDQLGLISAIADQQLVTFTNADGSERWSTDVGGPVLDVEDLGARDLVAVMVDRGDGGLLVTINATTGMIDRSFDLPDTADLVTSANAQTIAMVLPNAVHYYSLR